MGSTIFVYTVLLIATVAAQATFMPKFVAPALTPQILLVGALLWSLRGSALQGVLWALISGLLLDLFSFAPMGTTSLAMIAAVAVGLLVNDRLTAGRTTRIVTVGAAATATFWLIYTLEVRLLLPLLINEMPFLGVKAVSTLIGSRGLLADIRSEYSIGSRFATVVLGNIVLNGILLTAINELLVGLRRLTSRRQAAG